MLDRAQLEHFADHGWVLVEDVFDDARCAAFRAGLDRMARTRRHGQPGDPETTVLEHAVFDDPLFLEWLREPAIIEANRQCLEGEARFQGDNAFIKQPHPDRATRAAELSDPERWGWHRGQRPKHGTFVADEDPRLIRAAFLNNITYLTPVGPGDGATAILDGSHRHEGDFATLRHRLPIVQPAARAGSVLLFTECLIHAGTPILSERIRYCQFHGFIPRFAWPPPVPPPILYAQIIDDGLRSLLAP